MREKEGGGGGVAQKRIKSYNGGRGSKIDEFRAYVLFEWPESKNSWFYLVQWKPFKNNECSLFHLKSTFYYRKTASREGKFQDFWRHKLEHKELQ